MIFDSNHTGLGSSIAMAEGYDCSYGAALALVESARNEHKMFEAMLNIDAREMGIRESASGYVMESQLVALQEAGITGILSKIKELFTKLIAKVKAIFHTFFSKINALFMKDKELVKKYKVELKKKNNLDKMEVKWCRVKKSPIDTKIDEFTDTCIGDIKSDIAEAPDGYAEDADKRFTHYAGKIEGLPSNIDQDDFDEKMNEIFFEDEETDELGKFGVHITAVCNYLENAAKKSSDLNRAVKSFENKLQRKINEIGKKETDVAKEENFDQTRMSNATHNYEMAQSYQTVQLRYDQCVLSAVKKEYKQYKAVFMKAIAVNPDKLKESAIWANAIAEAAEDEVEDVITNAISDEDISEVSDASKYVKDADVTDCYDCLTDEPDSYSDMSYAPTSGVAKSESALFGNLFY